MSGLGTVTYRRRMPVGAHAHVNLSTRGASVSVRATKRVTVNSRGTVRVRLGKGLSWRIG